MLNLLKSTNINAATAEVIKRARNAATGEDPVYVIVPDRFTLQCEKLLAAGGGCLLDTRVLTFSMLYNVIHEELTDKAQQDAQETPLLDKTKAVLFLWRAAQNVKDKLVWFAGAVRHYNFAEKMYNTINQLTSSMVDFGNLAKNAKNDITRKKMQDIELIRHEYKNLTRDYTDSSGMLGFLIANIKRSAVIKTAKVFITGFEYMSIQRCAVAGELMRCAKEFTAGTREGSEFYDFLNRASFELKTESSVCDVPSPAPCTPTVCECANIHDEAARLANEVCGLVARGARFKDICVVLADFDNSVKLFSEVFRESGIAVNVDVGECLLENTLTLFLRDFLALANHDKCENLITVIKNHYSGLKPEEEFETENIALKHNLGARAFKSRLWFHDNLVKLAKCKTVRAICNELLELCSRVSDGASENGDDVAERKLTELLRVCSEVLGDQSMTLAEFGTVFATLANATKVSGVPTFADRVMLANAKEYEPSFVPHLFTAWAVSGVFPTEQDDDDIITEFDIKNMAVRIEPSASLQNRRAYIAAQNILSSATKNLFISYSATSASGEQNRCTDLIEGQGKTDENVQFWSKTYAKKSVLGALGTGEVFDEPLYWKNLLDAVDAGDLHIPELYKPPKNIKNATQLFGLPSVRVTQVENFYKCPYYHFLQNGLRLRQRELYGIAANIVGNIIHKFAEFLFACIINKQPYTIDGIIEQVFAQEDFAVFASDPINRPVITAIKKQMRVIGKTLVASIEKSQYKPALTEKEILHKMPDLGVILKGKTDRADTVTIDGREWVAVIDYKTGTGNFSYTDLYLGTKLQLPLYLDAISLERKAERGGAFYLPLKGGYSKTRTSLAYSGLATDEDENTKALGEVLGTAKRVSHGQMAAVINYANKMVTNAVQNIKAGYIKPSPCGKVVCNYCPSSCVCLFKETRRGEGIRAVTVRAFGGAE